MQAYVDFIFSKCSLDVANSKKYGSLSEDRTCFSVVIDPARRAC